jgi:AcrR family transcriptional regulator
VNASRRGRPRDLEIDDRLLEVTRRHLATHGYEAMSVVAIASEAGTTRQAVYRRWPSKADLATAAIAALASSEHRRVGDDHFVELVAELRRFQRGIGRPDGLSMVGTMLHRSTDRQLVELYRDRVVTPRRASLLSILERARDAGELDPHADLEAGVTM